ncbi:MAG: hypothetical protein WC582_00480 [Patescibacteria group bacterium]
MREIFGKIKEKKRIIFFVVPFFVFLFLGVNFAFAAEEIKAAVGVVSGTVGGAVAIILSWIAYLITALIGMMTTAFINLLIQVAQFSDIINVPTVVNGWIIIRDLCNMAFILILLLISFATILRVESYDVKKILPKLLIMAVLINFSRTIFGLMIDFSQVVMLTFVSSFKEGGGWFVNMFRIDVWGKVADVSLMKDAENWGADTWGVALAVISGVVAAIITLIVVAVMLAILVMRIVMLWIYTIFSPLVFLGFAFPPLQKYTGQIWEDFIKQLVVGPVLAFFIWLALTTASESSSALYGLSTTSSTNPICIGVGAFFCNDNLQKFIIVIGLLMGGLIVTQQMGSAAGSIAGKGLDWAKKTGMAPLKGAKEGTSALAGYGIDKLHQKTGVDLNLPRVWKGVQERRAERRSERYSEGMIKAGQVMKEGSSLHGMLAMTGSPGDAWDQITTLKGIRQRMKGGRYMAKEREKWGAPARELTELKAQRDGILSQSEFDKEKATRETRITSIDSELAAKNNELTKAMASGKSEDVEKIRVKISDLEAEKIAKTEQIGVMEKMVKDDEARDLDSRIATKKAEVEKNRPLMEKNIPMYNFEARAAENKAVSEKTSKVKDISDATELLGILEGAIKSKDKTMVKAIMKKMTKEGNDNEFLQPLVGNTGHHGLKQMMRELSDKNSKNYAGFGEQEAFALGSEIAETNKSTNHWAATSSYLMENGQWRETDDREHNEIRSIESGKMEPQAIVRNINRLGYGYHDKEGNFHIDAGGLILLRKLDNDGGIKNIKDRMDESAAQHVFNAITDESGNLKDKFKGQLSNELVQALQIRLGKVKGENFKLQYERVKNLA